MSVLGGKMSKIEKIKNLNISKKEKKEKLLAYYEICYNWFKENNEEENYAKFVAMQREVAKALSE